MVLKKKGIIDYRNVTVSKYIDNNDDNYSLRASDRFLGALEHLRGPMDEIYVGQLSPACGVHGYAFSQFPQI